MNANERDLPLPEERDLPVGRHLQLKEFVMSEIQAKPRHRRRLLRPAVLVPVLAAAALTIAVPALIGGVKPAFAVTDNPDGTITIKIFEAEDPKGLQETLRKRGFNAIVDYIPDGKKCSPQPRSTTWVPDVRLAHPQTPEEEEGGAGFRIDPSPVKPGQTAVLEFMVKDVWGQVQAGISDRVSDGPVAECVLVDKP